MEKRNKINYSNLSRLSLGCFTATLNSILNSILNYKKRNQFLSKLIILMRNTVSRAKRGKPEEFIIC